MSSAGAGTGASGNAGGGAGNGGALTAGGSGLGGSGLGGSGGGGGAGRPGSGGAGVGNAGAGSGAGGVATAGSAGRGGTSGGAAAGASGSGMSGGAGAGGGGGSNESPLSVTLFEDAVFYDGYAGLVMEPVPAGVRRLRNDLLTYRLSDEQLDAIQSTLQLRVTIGALCDNYDRIGSVALALVPKGQTTYDPADVERIEVGRYITPFMDKNRQPDEVSYDYAADNLVPIFHDASIRADFDLWFELELFGVPYAANEEVAGCAERNDVFRGSLTLASDSTAAAPAFDELMPLAYKEPFNNHQQGASDMLGTTRKTIEFVLALPTSDTQLVLITSNHGANTGGEEYSRRDHFVSVDGELELTYKPGRTSCEPFRQYNTQANGIYGSSPRSDATWQSFSNWCPGDVIDTRVIPLGPLSAGRHEFVIDVPDARFEGGEGNFPLSLYLQARH